MNTPTNDPFTNPPGDAPYTPPAPAPPAAPTAPPPAPAGYEQYGTNEQYGANGQYSSQAQPAYGAPAPYAPVPYAQNAPYTPQVSQEKNWMGIVSLILSLSSIIVGITVIPGIILGHMSLAAAKRGEANNRGLGLAGLITGYVLLGLSILLILGYLLFVGIFVAAASSSSTY
ncbi:DUF4190 domain-containing protein [Demequina sediminicola]|uniref:DUF4190 domain-containing protein n=1 Tax=Demequina sediminicola TaxID=1095026 RepID=UPI000782D249|nr:DUF4190 domain-containing protein [Demequina sediminicola]